MRMLFTFVGGRGHLEPLLPLARAARAAGHAVGVAGQPAIVGALDEPGLERHAIGPVTVGPLRRPLLAPDRAREDAVLRERFADRFARHRATSLGALYERWRPDVVVCDEVDFGAMLAAERIDLPHANVVVTPAGTFVRPQLVAEPLDRVRAELGMARDPGAAMLARDLVLVPAPPRFRDPASALPATARFVRPDGPRPGDASLRRPAAPAAARTVYATLGTIFPLESGDLFPRLVAGIRELDVALVVTLGGDMDPAELGTQPPNVRVERFVPQAQILARADAVVCHGGSGTIVGALAHGLPLVVVPLGADQPHNGARCAALGVGIVLDAVTASPSQVRDAVRSVLHDPRYRLNAERLRDEIAALPPAADVVPLLEQLAARPKP